MDGSENSQVQHQLQLFGEQEQYTSPYFADPSFSLLTPNHHTLFSNLYPTFSTMEFNELNNASAEADTGNSNSFIPSEDSSGYSYVPREHSCAKSDTDSSSEAGGNASESDEVISLEELLLEGKAKKKIEILAAMVGVGTTEPAIVLTEVVRVLKVLKKMNQYN